MYIFRKQKSLQPSATWYNYTSTTSITLENFSPPTLRKADILIGTPNGIVVCKAFKKLIYIFIIYILYMHFFYRFQACSGN